MYYFQCRVDINLVFLILQLLGSSLRITADEAGSEIVGYLLHNVVSYIAEPLSFCNTDLIFLLSLVF